MSSLLDALGIKRMKGLDETEAGGESKDYDEDNSLYNVFGLGKIFSGDGRYNFARQDLGYGGGPGVVVGPSNNDDNLNDDQKLMIATIYGEAAGRSPASWEGIANVIMNRVGRGEWKNHDTVSKVIQNTGFDAYSYPNDPYRIATDYLNNRDGSNPDIEKVIKVVLPIYNKQAFDTTKGAVLYYSPRAQRELHEQNPNIYGESPDWNFDELEEVNVPGSEGDDFKFYKYK